MALSAKQFYYLSEMNIPVWESKKQLLQKADKTKSIIAINDIEPLLKQQCFVDILTSLALTPADFRLDNNRLVFDFFNWQFAEDDTVFYENNQLITPSIENLNKSPALKKQCWALLSSQIVNNH